MASPSKRPAPVESDEDDDKYSYLFHEVENTDTSDSTTETTDGTTATTNGTTATTNGTTATSDDATKTTKKSMSPILKPGEPSGKRLDSLTWNDYFMGTALLAAKRSKDPNTQVGACIVDSDNRVVAIGYNGFPRGCDDDVFPWMKLRRKERERMPRRDKNMYVVHAEANAILNKNAASLENTRLYVTLFPCNECTKLIIQSGIKHIYYLSDAKAHQAKYEAAREMLDAADIKYEAFKSDRREITLRFY